VALTYRGGFAEAVIFKAGRRFDRDNFPKLFNSISSIKAKVRAGNIAQITVEITPNFQDGLEILQSGLLGVGLSAAGQVPPPPGEDEAGIKSLIASPLTSKVSTPSAAAAAGVGGKGVEFLPATTGYISVRFSYPDDLDSDDVPAETPLFTGMMSQPDLDFSGNDISITIHAVAYAGLLAGVEGATIFKKEPVLNAIKKLSESLDLKITFDENDTETEALLNSKFVTGAFNENKLQSIRQILYSIDCDFITHSGDDKIASSELRIKSRKAIAEGKIQYTFVMWRQIDTANNIMPMHNFSLESPRGLFLNGAAFGSLQRQLDPALYVNATIFYPS